MILKLSSFKSNYDDLFKNPGSHKNEKSCIKKTKKEMNLFKFLRKPTFSFFLALLVVVTSCSQYDGETIEVNSSESYLVIDKNESYTLDDYVQDHKALSAELFRLSDGQKYISNIQTDSFNNPQDLALEMSKLSPVNAQRIADLVFQVSHNTAKLFSLNPQFEQLGEEEFIAMVSDKLTTDITQNRSSCQSQYDAAEQGCQTTYAVGLLAAAASGFISIGAGWVIGVVALHANLAICMNNAQSAYEACQEAHM